jgi:hypothetical protein
VVVSPMPARDAAPGDVDENEAEALFDSCAHAVTLGVALRIRNGCFLFAFPVGLCHGMVVQLFGGVERPTRRAHGSCVFFHQRSASSLLMIW